jgi:4-amino-4-deoxy-L-arabinose transferase-like glycosyltransferase
VNRNRCTIDGKREAPEGQSRLLLLIIAGYLVAGALYARLTPPWQAPDEPAHYNYVRYLVEEGRLPVLRMGDYPHLYLEEIKAKRFPPEMSIDPLRYEFHQPPLYYLLASGVYRVTGGSLLGLRLLSVLLGAALLIVAGGMVRSVLPQKPALALGTTAFVAFLPMHVATSSAVNNDVLAELLLATSLLGLVRYARHGEFSPQQAVRVGLSIGLGLVTKMYAFIALPVALVAIAIAPRDECGQWRGRARARDGLLILGVAGLILLPWLVRNQLTYGGLDVWGFARHNQVVVGQPRTAEWLAQLGWGGLLGAFVGTTFTSFWGQFGWMGVLLDRRLYLALELLSALAGLGVLLCVARVPRPITARTRPGRRSGGQTGLPHWQLPGLLGLWLILTLLSYVWYNGQFVQHQGRYLFPALIPLGLAFAVGLSQMLQRRCARLMAGLCLSGVLLLIVNRLLRGSPDNWALALVAGAAVAFLIRGILPRRWDPWVNALPYVGLFTLDFVCLFGFIMPGLR